MGILVFIVPFLVHPIRQMHMPMKEKLGAVFLNQSPKGLKALVGQVPPIV